MLCSPTQTCFWAGRLTPAIRAMRESPTGWSAGKGCSRRSEHEIVTGSRVLWKPKAPWCPRPGMGSVPMLRRRIPAGPGVSPLPRALLWCANGPDPPPRGTAAGVAHRAGGGCAPRRREFWPSWLLAWRRTSAASTLTYDAVHGGAMGASGCPARPSMSGRSARTARHAALACPRSALEVRLLEQAFVLVRHQVGLDLGDEVHHHDHHDQQRGAAEVERDV